MNELETAMKWLALGQQIVERGTLVWEQIKLVLSQHGIEADTVALDAVIADADRRKAQAEADARG